MLDTEKGYVVAKKTMTLCEQARRVYDICFFEWYLAQPEKLKKVKSLLDGITIMVGLMQKRMTDKDIPFIDLQEANTDDIEKIMEMRKKRRELTIANENNRVNDDL